MNLILIAKILLLILGGMMGSVLSWGVIDTLINYYMIFHEKSNRFNEFLIKSVTIVGGIAGLIISTIIIFTANWSYKV